MCPDSRLKISIHALRGEGDNQDCIFDSATFDISIHALRGEGDVSFCGKKEKSSISIHALRGEGDANGKR